MVYVGNIYVHVQSAKYWRISDLNPRMRIFLFMMKLYLEGLFRILMVEYLTFVC